MLRMSCARASEDARRRPSLRSEPNTLYSLLVRMADSAAASALATDLASALSSPQTASRPSASL